MIKIVRLHQGQSICFLAKLMWMSTIMFVLFPFAIRCLGKYMEIDELTVTWTCIITASLGVTGYLLAFVLLAVLVIGSVGK